MNEELKNVSQTILQTPRILEVDIVPVSRFHKILQNRKILPAKKRIEFRPITLGSLIKISGLLIGIDNSIDTNNVMESNYQAMSKNGRDIAKIVAIAAVNGDKDPPERLINFILKNFTSAELANVVSIVLKQMDVQNFMKSIISMKGMNLLQKMSPTDQGSQIASGQ